VQNHDQVGNRALGDRLETVAGPELTRVAVVLLCAAPSTPLLFMGEEYGETRPFRFFTSHPEPQLAESVRQGRREEFAAFTTFAGEVPDPQDADTTAASTLDWPASEGPGGQARRALWTDLIHERRRRPALANGRRDLVEVHAVDTHTLVLTRGDPNAPPVLLAANLGPTAANRPLPTARGSWRLLLNSNDARYGGDARPATVEHDADTLLLRLPPRSASLWALDPDP
jgi:maltooligosyltrehalose trehalohydrolase